jgi:hypothetical protein
MRKSLESFAESWAGNTDNFESSGSLGKLLLIGNYPERMASGRFSSTISAGFVTGSQSRIGPGFLGNNPNPFVDL